MKVPVLLFGILALSSTIAQCYLDGEISTKGTLIIIVSVLIILINRLQARTESRHPFCGTILLSFFVVTAVTPSIIRFWGMLNGDDVAQPPLVLLPATIGLLGVALITMSFIVVKNFWRDWKAFGHLMGNWFARIVLSLFYFTLLLPFGFGVRLFSDPLRLGKKADKFWQSRTTGGQTLEEVRRQF